MTVFKTILKSWLHHCNFWVKFLLVIAILVMSATGALMIRLKKGPLDLDFVKVRIEQALSDKEKGYAVEIGEASLIWPEVAAPLLISLERFKITHDGKAALAVNDFSFSLSGLGLLKGKILPSQIIINRPAFKIFKEDGSFNDFWKSENENLTRVYGPIKPKELRENIADLLKTITDPKNKEIKTLSALTRIKVKEARLYGKNVKKLAVLNLTVENHDLGLAGDLEVTYPEEQGKIARFRSDVLYRYAQEDLTFTANLKDLHTSHIVPFLKGFDVITGQDLFFNGDLKAAFDKDLKLQLATMSLSMPGGECSIPNIYDTPVPLKDMSFKAELNNVEKTLDVTELKANIDDIIIEAKSLAKFEVGKLIAPIELKITDLPLESVPSIFPKAHIDRAAGQWLTQKLSKGRLYDVVINTDLHMLYDAKEKNRDTQLKNTTARFKAEGVTVQYHKTLKAVTDVVGEGSYADDVLTINGKSGQVGALKGEDVTVKITQLSVKQKGDVDIDIKASGPLKDALNYVSDEPIGLNDKLGFDVKSVKGDVDLNIQIDFPALKKVPKEQVKVKVTGTANNVLLPNIVQGLSLTGGPYQLEVEKGAVTLKGKGKLADRDIDLNWIQYLDGKKREYESKISAKVIADEGLRKAFNIDLKNNMSGALPVDVTYIDRGAKATLDVKADLTPVTLQIKSLGYKKDANVAGTLALKGYLNGPSIEEIDNFTIDTKGFSLSKGRLIFKKSKEGKSIIAQGSVPAVILGKTQASVDFETTNDNVLKAVVKGSVFDMEPFLSSDKKKVKKPSNDNKQPKKISVIADKILGEDGEFMTKGKVYLELNDAGDPTRIEMDANVGSGVMSLRFKPDASGMSNFEMQSTDAGHTLKVFGLYNKMRGGQINISGKPKRSEAGNNLYGKAIIRDFKIKSAPALAKLISAMSLPGVGALLNNDGLSFTKLQSDFEWRFRDQGNLLVMKEGRTSGNQLGLTFEGVANMGTGTKDISGTIIPLSGVNKAIGKIPVIGDILTGGDALFAATYSMKGEANDLKVTVNPLSVLAPGFVRKVLFEGDVDKKVKKEEAKE